MKKILLSTLLTATALFTSGCAPLYQMAIDQSEEYIMEHDLNDAVTYGCIDIVNKQNCPEDMIQKDFPIIPPILDARFCFGFSEPDESIQDGRKCLVRDFVKKFKVEE